MLAQLVLGVWLMIVHGRHSASPGAAPARAVTPPRRRRQTSADPAAIIDAEPEELTAWPQHLSTARWNSPEVGVENSPLCFGSIAAVAARRLDVGECGEVEIDDVLERLGGCAVAQAVGQGVEPGRVLGLQAEQFGDGVVPALRPAAAVH